MFSHVQNDPVIAIPIFIFPPVYILLISSKSLFKTTLPVLLQRILPGNPPHKAKFIPAMESMQGMEASSIMQ